MPIIICRNTGKTISAPEYSLEQKNKAWEFIVERGAERLLEGIAEDQGKPDEKRDNLTEKE